MTRTVALQMDPVETIDINGDSSFVLGLEAQKRSYTLYHYLPEALSLRNGRVTACARPLELRQEQDNHYSLGREEILDLSQLDVVLMRQDPPFDMAYITATHILEQIHPQTLVVNDPAHVRNAPEKLLVMEYPDLMPDTLVTRSEADIRAFRAEVGDVILKPLFGNGGAGIFRLKVDDPNLSPLLEMFFSQSREPLMVQRFMPEVEGGDKRIVLIDGELAFAINRIPQKGEVRSNLHAGGCALATDITPRDREICERLGPMLKKRGLIFTGIDVIGGQLTEINVTSPTCLQEGNRFYEACYEAQIWDAIERRL